MAKNTQHKPKKNVVQRILTAEYTQLAFTLIASILFIVALAVVSYYPDKTLTQIIFITLFFLFCAMTIGSGDLFQKRRKEVVIDDTHKMYLDHDQM